jgi:hypothetical protein
VRLEGLGKLKKITSQEIELATFRFAIQCINQLRYRVPQYIKEPITSVVELHIQSFLKLYSISVIIENIILQV